MKSEKIYDAITEIDEEYIEEAKITNIPAKKSFPWKTISAVAACFIVAIGIGTALRFVFSGAGAGGGSNREPGENYMSYAGPAFPLSALENTEGLEFERSINFDFSPYYTYQESYEDGNGETVYYDVYENSAVIGDNYVAKNTTDRDISFTAIYPFAGNMSTELSRVPQITVNGETVETELKIGPYSGGFSPAWGDESGASESLNLSSLESWYEYKALLENGEYQKDAFSENPPMNQPVKVYSFEIEYNLPMSEFDEIDNPDATVSFNYNADEADVFFYGFNGMSWNDEEGWAEVSASVPKSFNPDYGRNKMYIIVMNGDIENIETRSVAGYIENSKDEREETESFGIAKKSFETTFGELVYDIVSGMDYERYDGTESVKSVCSLISDEEYVGYVAEFMYAHGQLSENPAQRYDRGRLDDVISEVGYVSRVMYVVFEVTVPAGETVEIGTRTLREASYDFYGARNSENMDGFDMVTKLGTNLNIIEQSASVSNIEEIEIIHNNFGFDIPNGITGVLLGDEEHYWMEICKIRTEEN